MPTPIRFKQAYGSYDPSTIFEADEASKTLRPFSSGEAYTGSGFTFGQEQTADPGQYAGHSVGAPIDRAAALDAVKAELNQLQNDTFTQTTEAPAKRRASTIEDSIAQETESLNAAMTEFEELRKRMAGLTAPSYADEYTKLREQQGMPALEQDYVNVRKTRRELPYTERANTGNAGIATEGQLAAQTAQKDIPLEAEEANVIDRLKLASDFVANSIKFKGLDADTARQALSDAINLVGQTINLSQSRVSAAEAKKKEQQARQDAALQFRLENNITTPFFNSGGTIYDAGSLEGIPDEKTFQARYGITLQDAEAKGLVGKLDAGVQQDKGLVLDLASKYPDAGILTSDNFATASAKLKNSRIYQEQVRPPVSSGGNVPIGDNPQLYAGLSTPTATAVRAQVAAFKTEPTVQNFATIQDGYNFISAIADNTTNPADDQALIYSLAKALDPGSVVREGEYATAQKYAQSWVKAYGKGIEQAILGTGFLSTEARRNIKQTVEQKYRASLNSYENIYGEYTDTISSLTGRGDGQAFLKDYRTSTQPAASNGQPTNNAQADTPAPTSFWSKVGNWLWGN